MNGDELRDLSDETLLARFEQTKDGRYFSEIEQRYRRPMHAGAMAVLRDHEQAGVTRDVLLV
jgi:hypothetical protein